MSHVDVESAKEHLNELIEEVTQGGDVIITKDDRPVVRLVAVEHRQERPFGSAKGLVQMSDDFDAPLEDFRDYM